MLIQMCRILLNRSIIRCFVIVFIIKSQLASEEVHMVHKRLGRLHLGAAGLLSAQQGALLHNHCPSWLRTQGTVRGSLLFLTHPLKQACFRLSETLKLSRSSKDLFWHLWFWTHYVELFMQTSFVIIYIVHPVNILQSELVAFISSMW